MVAVVVHVVHLWSVVVEGIDVGRGGGLVGFPYGRAERACFVFGCGTRLRLIVVLKVRVEVDR